MRVSDWQSKTDQERHGESLYVCKSTRWVIRQYRQKVGVERGVLFRQIRRGDHVQSEDMPAYYARDIEAEHDAIARYKYGKGS